MAQGRNHGMALIGLASVLGASATLAFLLPGRGKPLLSGPQGDPMPPSQRPALPEPPNDAEAKLPPPEKTTRIRPPWEPARLTTYYPDAPKSQEKGEGGAFDRFGGKQKHPIIMWEQHQEDPVNYPFVTVASDVVLRGRQVPYGARVYLEPYPDIEFRLMDTGGNFYGSNKKVREAGHEPFDIPRRYATRKALGPPQSGTLTRYWVDFEDVIAYPPWLVVQRERAPVA